jgi:glycosyltransferase involved in cell wall biosynthesis
MDIIICEPSGHGKLSHYSFQLCQALFQLGHQITLVTSEDYELSGVDHSFSLEKIFSTPLAPPIYSNLNQFFQTHKANIVHFQWVPSAPFCWYLSLLAKRTNINLVYTAHNVLPHQRRFYHKYFFGSLYRNVSRLIVHSDYDKEQMLKIFSLAPAKIKVVPVGSSLMINNPPSLNEARRGLGIGIKTPVLLFLGYLSRSKGVNILLEALPKLRQYFPNIILIIAGQPVKGFSLDYKLIKEQSLEKNLILDLDYLPSEKIAKYLAASDVVVLPYQKINQSPIIPMAYSFGKPVVTSIKQIEQVKDGITGYMVTPGDIEELAAAIQKILLNSETKEKMSKAALELYKNHYSWMRVASRHIQVYEEIVFPPKSE